jgi:hypothetical protein
MPKLDPEEPTVAIAVFGKQVEDFLQSEIGDYLLQYAKREEAAAIEELIEVTDSERVSAARAKIYLARSFQRWLGIAVERGLQAMELIKEDANE